jgi:hypothetical protein
MYWLFCQKKVRMRVLYKRERFFSVCLAATTIVMLEVLSGSVLAQNVSDSDLSNSAGTNKNWYGSLWFFGVVIALIIVLIIAFSRKRKRSGTGMTNDERRR